MIGRAIIIHTPTGTSKMASTASRARCQPGMRRLRPGTAAGIPGPCNANPDDGAAGCDAQGRGAQDGDGGATYPGPGGCPDQSPKVIGGGAYSVGWDDNGATACVSATPPYCDPRGPTPTPGDGGRAVFPPGWLLPGDETVVTRILPHLPQKRSPVSLTMPHRWQTMTIAPLSSNSYLA